MMMLSKIRKRLTYTNVALTLALVFAMSGGAYAAGRYVITSTKQISPKVLRALKGANGKNGAIGPAGAPGAAGPQGQAGAKGETGPAGPQGVEGKEGKEGPEGKQGSPWTAGGTLPAGKTLEGQWNVGGYAAVADERFEASVSYGLPLAKAPITHYIRPSAPVPAGCLGSAEEPGAEPGNLCVFATSENNSLQEFLIYHFPSICDFGADSCNRTDPNAEGEGALDGFGIQGLAENAESEMEALGTWAVTAK